MTEIHKRVGDTDEEYMQRQPERTESMLHVKWWAVILIFLGIYAYFFLTIFTLNTRVTAAEVSISYTSKSVDEIKALTKENNQLLRDHIMYDGKRR